MEEHQNKTTRRGFLKGAALLGSVAATGGLAACTPQSGANNSESAMSNSTESTLTSFEIAPDPIGNDMIIETSEYDLVVVGAGTAGLATALSAAQRGLKVVLVSASSAPISRGGSNQAVYSKTMEQFSVPKLDMKDVVTEMLQGSFRVDQRKWARYYQRSEEAMNWLVNLMKQAGYMTVLEEAAGFPETSHFYQPISAHGWCLPEQVSAGGGQGFVVETLASEFVAAGGSLVYDTIARQLVRGGLANGSSGRVDAVIAEKEDGSYVQFIGSKAVVLATGDFSANGEMMEKYCSWAAPYFMDKEEIDYNVGITMGGLYRGDGHQMGLWVGAAWQHTVPCACMGGNIAVGPWRQLQENFLGLLVNNRGERYMNEAASSALGGMPAMLQPNHEVCAIWDVDYARFFKGTWHPFGAAYTLTPVLSPEEVVADWDSIVDNKGFQGYQRFDSLEELVSGMGLPESTLETIARYNELCRVGVDEDFLKDATYLAPIEKGPFYAAMKDTPDTMTVLGGLRTNVNMQVCDDADVPIEGLYNVGTMVGDMFAGIYTFQLQGANLGANCVCFGYLTGEYIAENE